MGQTRPPPHPSAASGQTSPKGRPTALNQYRGWRREAQTAMERKGSNGPPVGERQMYGCIPILDGLIPGPGSVYIVYIPSWPKTGGRTCRSWARDRPGQDRCIHKLGALLPWLCPVMAQESMSLLRGVCRPAFSGRSLRASEAPRERGEAFVAAMGARAPATEVRSGTMHGGGRL